MTAYLHWLGVHVIQTSLALVGASLSAFALADARRDLRAVKARRLNGLRLTLARWHVRNEAVRLLVQGIFAWVGVASAFWPDVPYGIHDAAITVIVLYATLANRIDRNQLFDIDEQQQGRP